jgi:hypothetical protein
MPLAGVNGTVVTLPQGEEAGTIQTVNGDLVTFENDVVSNEFGWDEVGPIEVGKDVKVWAIKLPLVTYYKATHIESNLEPYVGDEIMTAMIFDPDGLRLRKTYFDKMQHDAREAMDRSFEEMFVGG